MGVTLNLKTRKPKCTLTLPSCFARTIFVRFLWRKIELPQGNSSPRTDSPWLALGGSNGDAIAERLSRVCIANFDLTVIRVNAGG
jgi:hypothetical protein